MIAFRGESFGCEMEVTMKLIGGKWKALILWHLYQKDVMRFGELSRLHPGLTEKMLTQQLKELVSDGLVNRKVYLQVPPKVEYRLTERSQGLIPVFRGMIDWAKAYMKDEASLKN